MMRRPTSTLGTLPFCFCLGVLLFVGSPQAQPLANGFEQQAAGKQAPAGWFAGRSGTPEAYLEFAWDDSVVHSGGHSVSIGIREGHPEDRKDYVYNWTNTIEGFEVGATYELSAWVKTERLGVPPTVLVQCQDSSRTQVLAFATTYRDYALKGNTEWTLVKTTFTVPDSTRHVRVRACLKAGGNAGGRVWFDDIRVSRLSPPGRLSGERPVHTYSIVARDPATGELGVAVQSHWFSVGPVVPWAEAGVGAVATQSLVDVTYGPLGLELLRAGRSAEAALKALLAGDAHPELRQVAIVDAQGRVAAHTGPKCIAEAGHATGDGYSVQANLMRRNTVWGAMAKAYEAARGDLAERLLAALEAAQAEGGDIRGMQSAALLVVRGTSTGKPWEDRLVDLRVEDHPQPVAELKRFLRLHRAYRHMNAGDLAMEQNDFERASREYGAAEELAPGNAEMLFWHAVTLANAGRVEEAKPLLGRAYALDPGWRELVARLPASGLLTDDARLVRELASVPAAGAPAAARR
jgi:uncharacterized Ntn-hydrolase superfamily protein